MALSTLPVRREVFLPSHARQTSRTPLSVIRVEKIFAEGAQKTERHNERKNESYANLNVDTEQIARNVHFKDTGGLTYNEYFQRFIDEGKISTRGQKTDVPQVLFCSARQAL